MDNRAIGIFDSGLGGLTCVKKVMEIMPNEDIIYFGDTGRVPYGTRSKETIIKYVRQDVKFLESFDIKLIIIACGTASSAALPEIKSEIGTNIIGVLAPTCKAAISATRNGKIGVIGTAGAIKSGKYAEEINKVKPDIKVFSRACPLFVPLVENGYTSGQIAQLAVEEYLEPLKRENIDTLILGCTHYPLLRDEIGRYMGKNVTLINSGAEAATEAKCILKNNDSLAAEKKGSAQFFVSDTIDGFAELGSVFLEKSIKGSVEYIEIEKY